MVQTTQITLRDRVQTIEDAISAGQIEDAMNACQRILARYPDALEIQRLLGEVYLAQGRLDEAQQTFDWILVNDPENVIVYCDRALICEHNSDIDTSLDCYQQAYELSRGNSQIRQEFNNLSARAGQQEFMLSRAGLARLYMRGHLFTQAIYEWEAVLTASPDRLDARLGLLETCWRDGQYDEVERMASRILEEVPQCLKALLLLAHIASAYNMQRAQSLIERAVLLDPELITAQDLFSELATSQPNDPFLAIIQREPIELADGEMNGNGKAIDSVNTLHYTTINVEAESPNNHSADDHIYDWNDMDSWSELDTRSVPQAASGASSEHPAAPASVETTGNTPEQDEPIDDFETWVKQQEIDDDFDAALLEKQPWFQAEQANAAGDSPEADEADLAADTSDAVPPLPKSHAIFSETDLQAVQVEAEEDSDSWNAFAPQDKPWNDFVPKEEASAAPAWLDMLTNFDQRPSASAKPAAPVPPVAPAPSASTEPSSSATPQAVWPAGEPEDDDMGWPEWLKSLGAETMEAEPSTHDAEAQQPVSSDPWGEIFQGSPAPTTVQAPESELASYPDWAEKPQTQRSDVPDTDATASWNAQIEQLEQAMLPGNEASLITTLETLEQNLRSQGFVPLQPGALSAIAQETPPTLSPLAEGEESQPAREVVAELPAFIDVQLPPALNTPSAQALGLPAVQEQFQGAPAPVEPLAASVPPLLPVEAAPADRPTQPLRLAAEPLPAPSLDMLLDSELETTMRRPAIRLQPMQAAPSQADRPYASSARGVDYSSKSADSKLTNKERLVRGYQLQLAGAYDDAMQEYRTLTRNSPESLGEVISNVRALLKLAPKYTAGYRVLGDAYMRQGEYLQAMEAYNKALTIAKKAKSQSR